MYLLIADNLCWLRCWFRRRLRCGRLRGWFRRRLRRWNLSRRRRRPRRRRARGRRSGVWRRRRRRSRRRCNRIIIVRALVLAVRDEPSPGADSRGYEGAMRFTSFVLATTARRIVRVLEATPTDLLGEEALRRLQRWATARSIRSKNASGSATNFLTLISRQSLLSIVTLTIPSARCKCSSS